jgi:hypothetical protein
MSGGNLDSGAGRLHTGVVKRLAWALGALTVLLFGLGLVAVALSPQGDVALEAGRALLTVAFASAVAGGVSVVIQRVEDKRAKRTAWEAMLQQVIAASHAVEAVQTQLRANRTASTYRKQFVELIRVRAVLRSVTVGKDVHDYQVLRKAVKNMLDYLDGLIKEYEDKYYEVAVQRRLDKQLATTLLAGAAADQAAEVAPCHAPGWLSVRQLLQDENTFPELTAFLKVNDWDNSDFHTNYKDAKHFLENLAGIPRSDEDPAGDDTTVH